MHTLCSKHHSIKTTHKIGDSIDLQVFRQFEKSDPQAESNFSGHDETSTEQKRPITATGRGDLRGRFRAVVHYRYYRQNRGNLCSRFAEIYTSDLNA